MTSRGAGLIRVKLFRQTINDVFGNNSDLYDTCVDNVYKAEQENIFSYSGSLIAEHSHAEARNQIMNLLRERKDIAERTSISDIAVEYSKEWEDYSVAAIDSKKVNSILSKLNDKKVEFTLRRYFYLQDKHQVLREMRLENSEFEKMKGEIEQSFGCNTIRLLESMKGMNLEYLKEYNEKIYTELAYLGDDRIQPQPRISKTERERMEHKLYDAIYCGVILVILSIIGFILKLAWRY